MCMIIELVLSRFRSLIFFQLMALLDSMSCEDVITWLPQGRGFVIFDKKKLAEEVLPRHFQGTKYTSFTRRLRRWNFAIQTDGHKRASYFHPSFIRGQPELCRTMVAVQQIRKKRKSGNLPTSQTSSFNYSNQSDISNGSSSNGASNTDNIHYQAAMSNNEIGGMAFNGARGNSSMVQNLRSYAKNPQSEIMQRKNGSSDGFTDQSQTNLSFNFPHSSIMSPNSMDDRGMHSYPHHPSFMNNHLSQSDQLLMLQKRQEEQQLERNLRISNFMGATVQKYPLHDQHKNDLAVYDETQRRILLLKRQQSLVEQERRNMLLLRYQTSQHQQRIEPNTAIGNRHMHTTGIYNTTGALGGTHSNENNIIIRQQENSHIRSNYQGIEQSNSIAENEMKERIGRPSNSSTPRNYQEI